ncbi:MAG: class I SAM-dependent methyltransferase [Acidimicrobiales bacterium]|nr:class I SAM-dependent methyltransferase [Acidimicrobiales bacterium]
MSKQPSSGRCGVCGWVGVFERGDFGRPPGASFPCEQCGARLRYRDEATAVVEHFGDGEATCLMELLERPDFAALTVLYVGVSGPLRGRLRALPNFFECTLEPPDNNSAKPKRRSYQDLQALGFAPASFDWIFSSHVMEHVPDPDRAFAEAHRVLRPGGALVFSVPMVPSGDTVVRGEVSDGAVVHHLDPKYHRSPQGRSLVFNDFGEDVADRLHEHGFEASVRRPTGPLMTYSNAIVFAARR